MHFDFVVGINSHFMYLLPTVIGFDDTSGMWLRSYESDSFKSDIDELWSNLSPLYQEIHAYVRTKLRQTYGDSVIGDDGLIPAHLLGKTNT